LGDLKPRDRIGQCIGQLLAGAILLRELNAVLEFRHPVDTGSGALSVE
jgi:hypothetical protein